jgi:hypothetical protein
MSTWIGSQVYLMELCWANVPAHLLSLAQVAVELCTGHLGEALHRKIDRVKQILEPAATMTKEEGGGGGVHQGAVGYRIWSVEAWAT